MGSVPSVESAEVSWALEVVRGNSAPQFFPASGGPGLAFPAHPLVVGEPSLPLVTPVPSISLPAWQFLDSR